MRSRKYEYDVSNQVRTTDASSVCDAVTEIFTSLYPGADKSYLQQAFEDCNNLFEGDFPGYQRCDTLYHDKQHTLDMTLALARLIDGHERSEPHELRFGPQLTNIAIITALYHDSGYMRHTHDHKHKNGAEYTLVHVSRSADFLKRYFHKIRLGKFAHIAANMVHYTGYEVAPDEIKLPNEKAHTIGHMIGTADMIAQMSDRCYLEKCRDRLYPEFVLGGIAVHVNKQGKRDVLYTSPEDLMIKTPAFYEQEVRKRLDGLFDSVYRYEEVHFGGNKLYIQSLEQNQIYIKSIIDKDNFSTELLRREPPRNYGVDNFPGLESFDLDSLSVRSDSRN